MKSEWMPFQAACSGLSTFACLGTAAMLFLLKRKSHLHYRLEIGLCFSFGLTNLCDFVVSFTGWENSTSDEPDYQIEQIGLRFHVYTLSATIHYIIMMYLNYLLKSYGRSEESLHKKERWMHVYAWVMSIPFVLIFSFVTNEVALTATLLIIFSLHLCFIVGCTAGIVIQQKKSFHINNEVNSPLITTQERATLTSFLRRLVFLTVLTFLIYLQAFLFSTHFAWTYLADNHVIQFVPLVSLDGLLVSIFLASTPQLVKEYKKKYHEWFKHDYEPVLGLPASPYISSDASARMRQKAPASRPKRVVQRVDVSITI